MPRCGSIWFMTGRAWRCSALASNRGWRASAVAANTSLSLIWPSNLLSRSWSVAMEEESSVTCASAVSRASSNGCTVGSPSRNGSAILSASAGVIWGLKGLIYLLIAANISAIAEFLIARYFAREAVEKLIKGKISHIDKAIERRGFVTVLLIRLIPNVAWDIQNLGLGLTKVKFRDYFLATLIGIIPGSFALVYFGSSFISVITNPKHFWKIIVAFIIFGAVYYLQQFLKRKQNGVVSKPAGRAEP